ncbi:MAG: M16 family metallopeptidase [Phycisphaerae bacterium]
MTLAVAPPKYHHEFLSSGVEFAAEEMPERNTVAIMIRLLAGTADSAEEHTGVAELVEDVLPKGTLTRSGKDLADAFDLLGVKWGGATGRQSTLFRALCLPEYTHDVIDLLAEFLTQPALDDDVCRVSIELAQQELKTLEDSPDDLVRVMSQLATYGPRYGRWSGGTTESLEAITPDIMRSFYREFYCAGRMQFAVAGRVHVEDVAAQLDRCFERFGSGVPAGREDALFPWSPTKQHQSKDLEQEYIAITLPGATRGTTAFPMEQVMLGVLSGGMSSRLFTEVREKLGLVYWVGAWHEQPRGSGAIHLGASTTPARCRKTFETLLGELKRLGKDVTQEEVDRAKNQIISHAYTDDDLTRAHASGLSDDLFHFGKPIGVEPKLDAIRAVRLADVRAYAKALRIQELCVCTLGSEKI